MNYTKGEWTKEGNKIKVLGQGTIAICPSPTNNEGVFEFVTNAHLIAAAPAMYEALKQAQQGAGDWRGVIDLVLAKAEEK